MAEDDELDLKSPSELAGLLNITPETCYDWRRLGKGPNYIKINNRVYYRMSEIKKWLKDNEDRKS